MKIVKEYLEKITDNIAAEQDNIQSLIINQPYIIGEIADEHTSRIVDMVLETYPEIYEGNQEWLTNRVSTHVNNILQLTPLLFQEIILLHRHILIVVMHYK